MIDLHRRLRPRVDRAGRRRGAARDGRPGRRRAARASALLRRPFPRRARPHPRPAVFPHPRGRSRPSLGRRRGRRPRSHAGRGCGRTRAEPRTRPDAGRRADAAAERALGAARRHSVGRAIVRTLLPVATAAAAVAQPHRPVRAGAAAGRVHRQPDRRLSDVDHRAAHGRGRRRHRGHCGGAGAVDRR